MENRTGKLFVLSGPSGAGKGTIVKRLLEDAEPGTLALSISMTTRAPREGERDGVSYFFVTKEAFEEKIAAGGLLEYADVYGHYYGTPRAYVEKCLAAGTDVLLEIDIQGAMNVKRAFPDGVFLFVAPPSMDVLRDRLTGRATDAEDVIRLRLSKAVSELEYIPEYDYLIINDDLDRAVRDAEAAIRAEHVRVTDGKFQALLSEYRR